MQILGQVTGLPAESLDQARDAVFHADHPFLIVLVGAFNTGKSSLINALLGDPVLGVGATPTTDRIVIVRHGDSVQRTVGDSDTIFHPAPLLETASLVDTPGVDSVFTGHDDTTRRFLHRADMVWLVMLATQAMSQANVAYLQSLRDYGKRIVIVINQIDLLDSDEQGTLQQFVTQQAKTTLGVDPDVWLISAKWALQAEAPIHDGGVRDETLWRQSGFDKITRFLTEALDDEARVQQKLTTPLQTARRVTELASAQIRTQQNTLAAYKQTSQNVRRQIDQAIAEQRVTVQATQQAISTAFVETEQRGGAAIRATFQLSRAAALVGGGLSALAGMTRLLRLAGGKSQVESAFTDLRVLEPLDSLPTLIDGLGPQLEGRDLKDIDDLIAYARKSLAELPPELSQRLVGQLSVPTTYDRSILPGARPALTTLIDKARRDEALTINRSVQNTLIVLAFYEVVVLLVGLVFGLAFGGTTNGGVWIALVLLVLLLMLGGLALMPVRGWLLARGYTARLEAIRADLSATLQRAADQQIAFGSRLRLDAVTPFLRLIEAQTEQADTLSAALEKQQQVLTTLETTLASLGGKGDRRV